MLRKKLKCTRKYCSGEHEGEMQITFELIQEQRSCCCFWNPFQGNTDGNSTFSIFVPLSSLQTENVEEQEIEGYHYPINKDSFMREVAYKLLYDGFSIAKPAVIVTPTNSAMNYGATLQIQRNPQSLEVNDLISENADQDLFNALTRLNEASQSNAISIIQREIVSYLRPMGSCKSCLREFDNKFQECTRDDRYSRVYLSPGI